MNQQQITPETDEQGWGVGYRHDTYSMNYGDGLLRIVPYLSVYVDSEEIEDGERHRITETMHNHFPDLKGRVNLQIEAMDFEADRSPYTDRCYLSLYFNLEWSKPAADDIRIKEVELRLCYESAMFKELNAAIGNYREQFHLCRAEQLKRFLKALGGSQTEQDQVIALFEQVALGVTP